MKLGRWGWGLKWLSLARFQRNCTMGLGESSKKWVAEALFFCHVYDAPLLPLSLDRFPPNFPRTRVQVVAHNTWFHIPEKFLVSGRISWKTVFFRVQNGTRFVRRLRVMGNILQCQNSFHPLIEHSAMPKLFPSPHRHPTYLSFLGDFCWGMYHFPAIHVRSYRKARYRYESK